MERCGTRISLAFAGQALYAHTDAVEQLSVIGTGGERAFPRITT
ncbi:hypothetical protein [Hymenobacter crusticola]|nr:hypothetical protein [Hymenobacter crusticola]